MDIPKGLIQKLSILKNTSAFLVPVILLLVAVLLFIPTQLMSSKLKKRMEQESISKGGRQIKSFTTVVSREQWRKMAERQQVYANDANQVALLSERSSQRELLSYKIFPKPKDTSTEVFKEFGQRYCGAVDKLIADVNARDCPTGDELLKALERSSGKSRSAGTYSSMEPSSSTRSSRIPQMRFNEVENKIVDEICQERAESISVYVNPFDLAGYEYWEGYQYDVGIGKSVEDCWYYQLACWVIEDVIDTIGACNAGSNGVLTSPVKRIMGVKFNLGQGRSRRSSGRTRGVVASSVDRPAYVLSPKEALIEPCTGRSCNDDIDVIHFNVIVLVSAEEVLPFMQQLCSAKKHKFAGYSGDEQEQTF